MIPDRNKMKLKLRFLVALFCRAVMSYPIVGKWVPTNMSGVILDVSETHVIGTMNEKESVEMKIVGLNEKIFTLNDLRIRKKPADWFNAIKYKDHIDMFQKIKHYGIVCHFNFINNGDILEIRPKIGESEYEFILTRQHDPEIKK